jgi:sugar phosphate isomerase/epimerase
MAASIPRVLASTTSHKREPLMPTLEVFGKLGLRDVDLNLHHILELGETPAAVAAAAKANGLRLWVVSGGWCDFFKSSPDIDTTFVSVGRQVAIARVMGVSRVRLFFGRLEYDRYSRTAFSLVRDNLLRLSDVHSDVMFVFENHDGASLRPEVCREILAAVARPNILMNLDPINFAKAGVDPMLALQEVQGYVGHVHLKGLQRGEYCEFGEGDVDLNPVIHALLAQEYRGSFTVEYEGPFDGTLRLYRSVERARAVVAG